MPGAVYSTRNPVHGVQHVQIAAAVHAINAVEIVGGGACRGRRRWLPARTYFECTDCSAPGKDCSSPPARRWRIAILRVVPQRRADAVVRIADGRHAGEPGLAGRGVLEVFERRVHVALQQQLAGKPAGVGDLQRQFAGQLAREGCIQQDGIRRLQRSDRFPGTRRRFR